MAYRPFYNSVSESTPATVATIATLQGPNRGSVATVANVAAPKPETYSDPGRNVAIVATVVWGIANTKNSHPVDRAALEPPHIAKPTDPHDDLSVEDCQEAFEERAAILEYDQNLPREEAERLARIQIFRQ